LNEIGQAQLTARPSIIPAIFSIFTSERHLKVLLEKENAVLIGTAIDELIRHHPMLKTPVFEAMKSTMTKIEELGNAFEPSEDSRQWYKLLSTPAAETESSMEGVEETEVVVGPATLSSETEPPMSSSGAEEFIQKPHDNNVVSFIDVFGRVRFFLRILKSITHSLYTVLGRTFSAHSPLPGFYFVHRWSHSSRTLDCSSLSSI
jgi:E3 ubiquitin-protein ligase HUWE1